MGAEWVRAQVKSGSRNIALVGATAADVRDTMIEGPAGILSVCPPWEQPVYERSKRRLTWPNGAIATSYSADEPNRLRGHNSDAAWADELAAWRKPDAWSMLRLGLRSGENPQCVVSTTPRPIKIIKDLIKDPSCVVTRGSTFSNQENLAAGFFEDIISQYEGTRLGRQEIYAEVLEDMQGALWTHEMFETTRVKQAQSPHERIVVAVDPAVTSGDSADLTGIIVVSKSRQGHGYVREDLTCKASPNEWAKIVVEAYHKYKADRIVAEVNNGGDMVESVIRTVDPHVAYSKVHATRGKLIRAEPVAALYEQKKMHHVGVFPELEDECCDYVPGVSKKSPDRMDALCWAVHELFLKNMRAGAVKDVGVVDMGLVRPSPWDV